MKTIMGNECTDCNLMTKVNQVQVLGKGDWRVFVNIEGVVVLPTGERLYMSGGVLLSANKTN